MTYRRFWSRLQWVIGVMNAYSMIDGIAQRRFALAAFYGACVLMTALWRIPPPTDQP